MDYKVLSMDEAWDEEFSKSPGLYLEVEKSSKKWLKKEVKKFDKKDPTQDANALAGHKWFHKKDKTTESETGKVLEKKSVKKNMIGPEAMPMDNSINAKKSASWSQKFSGTEHAEQAAKLEKSQAMADLLQAQLKYVSKDLETKMAALEQQAKKV